MGSLLFLIYVNGTSQAVTCEFFLYADHLLVVFHHKDINKTEKQLNDDFYNIFDWFVANKLSIQFGEDKPKSILRHFLSNASVQSILIMHVLHGIQI